MEGAWGTPLDFSGIRTHSLRSRRNLVTRSSVADITQPPPDWDHPELGELVERLAEVARAERVLVWSLGAHVIKAGLGPYVSDLAARGILKHVAGNGAVAIHDFELALQGATSEDVASALEDGTFGMWEETGRFMHEAVADGVRRGEGYGQALGRYMDARPDRFPYRELSVIWNLYRVRCPLTLHVTIGADIIHQHPAVDFSAVGQASGTDFKIFCRTVSRLEGGAYLNFGSAVTGPEVFLKALAIARNLGHPVKRFTTANFDVVKLGDYRDAVIQDEIRPEYFYRPWKNIVVRPPSLGGKGFHLEGKHQDTMPVVYDRLLRTLARP